MSVPEDDDIRLRRSCTEFSSTSAESDLLIKSEESGKTVLFPYLNNTVLYRPTKRFPPLLQVF